MSPPTPESASDRIVRFFAGPQGWLEASPVTRVLIWLNVIVFAGELLYAARLGERTLVGALPDRVMLATGANYAVATVREQRSEALVASCFVHASLLHVALNMLSLRNIGPLVERDAGSARMAPLYLLSGIGGSVASAAVGMVTRDGERLSVGASGALFGVMGAAMVVGWRTEGFRGPMTQTMLRWLLFWMAFGLLASGGALALDNAAHLGGAITGIGVATAWRRDKVYTPRARQMVLAACAAVLTATALTVTARSLVSRYASMTAMERVAEVGHALARDDCAEARRALRAFARLRPTDAAREREKVEMQCGVDAPAR